MRIQKSAQAAIGFAALACMLCLFLPSRLAAQIDTGGITGTVLDPSGAAVPGANITLTNVSTNVQRTSVSTATGNYSFNGLLPGTYTIAASASGFQHYMVHGVTVHLQQTTTTDIHLKTGNVQQNVTVTAAPPLLQTESGQVGQTVNNQAVEDLPLVTRDWGSLSQLSAGVNTAPPGQPTPDSGSTEGAYFSVNGVNIWQNDFRLDGINDNIEIYGGNYTGTNAAIVPPPDAVQEFKVQTGDYNAAFGHSTGGVVNAVIKSGSNSLHGDVWEYLRNDAFNANYFFNRKCASSGVCVSNPIPEYRQNLFGVTAGGPVIKNKTFWFFDYQGGRYVLPEPSTSTVPTTAMASSGFTNLQENITGRYGAHCSPTDTSQCTADALGRKFYAGTIFDPATTRTIPATGIDPITGLTGTPGAYVRDPFYNCNATTGCPAANYAAGGPLTGVTDFTTPTQLAMLNVLPSSRLDPNAVKLLGVYPAPTSSGLTNNFLWVPKEDHNTNTYDIRIDENLSANNKLWGVYDRSLFTTDVPGNLPGLAVGEGGARVDSLPAYAWAVGYTRIFTPTLTNDMTVGMVHSDKLQKSVYGDTFGIPANYGILGTQQVANNGGIPPISLNGFTHIGVGNYTPTLQYVWSIEGDDNITKVYRGHTFQMGIEVDDMEGDISQPPQGRGDFNFNGQYTDVPNSNSNDNGIADMLVTPMVSLVGGVDNVGGMSSFSGSDIAATDDHRWYWAAYFQDDWKATTNLTLNLGLRWDYFTPYAETRGRQANFIPAGGNGPGGVYQITTQGCQVPRSTGFDANLTKDGISLACVPSLTLGGAQKTNFAPRLGFAYRATSRLVVRGGYGVTYGALGNLGYGGTLGTNYPFVYVDQFNSPDSQHPLLLSDGTPATMEHTFQTVNLQDPTLNSGEGLNLYGRQYNFQTPYVETQNLTVQDQFTNHDSIQVGYVGTEGRHLDNLGYSNSPTEILPPGVNPQDYVPFPDFNRNATYETTNATSSYNSLQITYEHQMSDGLYFLGNYTWGKCMTDQHTQAEQNSQYRAEWLPGFGISRAYALCDTDATHLVHTAASYDLPFGHGRRFGAGSSKAVDLLLGGWVVNGIYSFQSGQPFTISCPTATTSDFGCFADLTGKSLYAGPHNYTQWLNPDAFAQPPKATAIGQADFAPLGGGQMQARGPHWNNFDSSVLKNFHVTESVRVQFRAEAFNTTNTPPLGTPGQLNFDNSNFSNISSTLNSNGNFGARTLQFALKLFY
jgi:hypothetical protein